MRKIKPLNDFIFKKLFGEKGDEEILISFINAVLKRTNEEPIVEIEIIENKALTKDLIEDKTGIIDVRARTGKGENIDIEVQLTNQGNMGKRTLFYWSKMYLENIKQGEDYANLEKVITINILDFNYLDVESYQSSFHLYEDIEKDYMLTDMVEIHFIEIPKFKAKKNKNYKENEIERWLAFLDKDLPDAALEELMSLDMAIKKAEDKLMYLSSDETVMKKYWERERSLHERANMINSAEERTKTEIAANLLDILDDETIALKTGLDIEKIKKLRLEMKK